MACIRKRRGKWVLDYRDQQGRRHWETVEGNRKAADELLAQRIREVGRGTYQAPHELVDFDALAASYLQHAKGATRETTFNDYAGDLRRNISPYFTGRKIRGIRRIDVEAFRAHLLEKGKGTRTVNKCLTLLGQMCRTPCGTSGLILTPPKALSSAQAHAVATISSRAISLRR